MRSEEEPEHPPLGWKLTDMRMAASSPLLPAVLPIEGMYGGRW